MTVSGFGRTATAAFALACLFTATPARFEATDHGVSLTTAKAFAKDGRSDDSSGSGKSSGGGGGKSGGDDSDDDSDDSSGSGKSGGGGGGKSGGGDSDDSSGSSGSSKSGGSDDDSSGSGRGKSGSSDDGPNDDKGGRGRGTDDGAGGDRPSLGSTAAPGGNLRVVKVERSAAGVEIVYSSGVKEEVENGRYQLKDAGGRTVTERAATQRDVNRIQANARNSGLTPPRFGGSRLPSNSQASSVEVSGSAIEVRYSTGWKEEIESGRYELKDPNNNTVVERPATTVDRDRMLALAGS